MLILKVNLSDIWENHKMHREVVSGLMLILCATLLNGCNIFSSDSYAQDNACKESKTVAQIYLGTINSINEGEEINKLNMSTLINPLGEHFIRTLTKGRRACFGHAERVIKASKVALKNRASDLKNILIQICTRPSRKTRDGMSISAIKSQRELAKKALRYIGHPTTLCLN